MSIAHAGLAVLVALIWGLNFIFIRMGLSELPPLLLCALRFFLASLPLIAFIRFPKLPLKTVLAYGLIMFALQFAFLFMGLSAGMTAGVASLLVQVQLFFSLFFARIFLEDSLNPFQLLGALIAFSGIVYIGLHLGPEIHLAGFLYILAAAATWGIGNLISKQAGAANGMSLIVWSCFVAGPPILLLSFCLEGSTLIWQSLSQASFRSVIAVFYIACISTWVGYGLWNWLLSQHPLSQVIPFSLLVPVVGILSSALFLGERLDTWKLIAAAIVLLGLYCNYYGSKPRSNTAKYPLFKP